MRKLFKQAIRFFGVSGIGWLIDFILFSVLSFVNNGHVTANNTASSLLGAVFVFTFSTKTVFEKKTGRISLHLKLVIYLIYIVCLIVLVSKILAFFVSAVQEAPPLAAIAALVPLIGKICITPVTMCINFLVMKGLIEKL